MLMMAHYTYTDTGQGPGNNRKLKNGTMNDTGYTSLHLNGAYDVANTTVPDSSRRTGPRGRGVIPILVIAGATIVFAIASVLLLYYNYVAYKPQEIINQDPCETATCPVGAKCRVVNGAAVCSCLTVCPSTPAQVCGSDGRTYLNLCHLRRSACVNNTNVGVQYPGHCGGTDPCEKVKCRPGARCVVSQSGQPSCQCPTSCADYGDHSGSRPVCGEDAVDYKDMCSINLASCTSDKGVQMKYHGPCDPCAGVVCPGGEVCLVTEGRVARCSCPEMCPLQESPVCATDGQTYSNECYMRLEACRTRKQLNIMYRDSCSTGVNPCSGLKCEHGSFCLVNKEGQASCQCPPECEQVMRPVCGTDGTTYDSSCHLKRKACLEKGDAKVAYTGVCGADGPCTHKDCGPLAVCKQTGPIAECVCNSCGSEYEPVCGTDGISYGNVCKLRREACLRGKTIEVLYQGLCDGCETKKCEFFSTCLSDSSGEARCVCNRNCSATVGEQVCGTDGITYQNACELKMTACQNKLNIQVAYKGDCESCAGVVCQYRAKCSGGQCVCPTDCSAAPVEQVCGSDLITYQSQCELQKRGCELGDPTLDVLFYGSCERRSNRPMIGQAMTTPLSISVDREEACKDVRCDFDATCEPDPEGYPRCVCVFDCSSAGGNQVCGSDLNLYQTSCQMRGEACARQIEIRARPMELCQGMEVKPCGGDEPLTDPGTEEDLDCGNGHNRQDCPSEYYCHQTSTFAKCCRKESGVYLKDCEDSWYGCCPDAKTPAQGPDQQGCPEDCGCNKIGSYSGWCENGQCKCRPGVGGPKCDRCHSGYWGLPKISSGYRGCLPCGCSLFGSVRDDCEQMTGKCVCKPGVGGDKCDTCHNSKHVLTPSGCLPADATTPIPTSCSQLVCYFGAVCEEKDSKASCVCSANCPLTDKQVVCGSDGQTYGSECQLDLYACKYQMDITVASFGACKEGEDGGHSGGVTDSPAKRWTSYSLMASPLSKSTRHLLQDKYNLQGRNRDTYVVDGHVTSAAADLGSFLNEPCTYSEDCSVPGSECKGGICLCGKGFTQNREKTQCIKEDVPSFEGNSWIRLRHMKAYHKFNLELEFRTFNQDGILFYAQQHADGSGDFIALSLINGYVVLSYNLGSGTVKATSLVRVSLGDWHKAKVRRYQRDALLQVDTEEPVPVQSQGTLVALDLNQNPYLGYVPSNHSKVFQNAGTERGLVGCMRASHLEVEHMHLITLCNNNPCQSRPCLNQGTCLPVDGSATCICPHNFTGQFCEELLNPCAYKVCSSNTRCKSFEGGGFQCECSPELEMNCDTGDQEVMEFDKDFLTLTKLEGVSRAFSIEIWFKSYQNEASLLYNSQLINGGKGDFVSLTIEESYPVFSYSLGGNPAIIRGNESITLNKWHSILISRTDKEGTLRLDQGFIFRGQSGGDHLELNLEQPLYIGKPPTLEDVPSFSGAVQRLVINGIRHHLQSSAPPSLRHYTGDPCYSPPTASPCSANQTCLPILSDFRCVCAIGCTSSSHIQSGLRHGVDDSDGDESAVHFDGAVVVKHPRRIPKRNESSYDDDYTDEYDMVEGETDYFEEVEEYNGDDEMVEDYYEYFGEKRRGTRIELWIKTHESDGPLLISKSPKIWALVVSEGRIVLNARLREKHISLASKIRVDDGQWHRIVAGRRRKQIHVQVDSEAAVRMAVGQGVSRAKRFWLGGCPSLPEGLPSTFYTHFKGCMKKVSLDRKQIDLRSVAPDLEPCMDNSIR